MVTGAAGGRCRAVIQAAVKCIRATRSRVIIHNAVIQLRLIRRTALISRVADKSAVIQGTVSPTTIGRGVVGDDTSCQNSTTPHQHNCCRVGGHQTVIQFATCPPDIRCRVTSDGAIGSKSKNMPHQLLRPNCQSAHSCSRHKSWQHPQHRPHCWSRCNCSTCLQMHRRRNVSWQSCPRTHS